MARRLRHGHFEAPVLCRLCEPIFRNYLAGIVWDRVLRWMFVVWNNCPEDRPVARIRQVARGKERPSRPRQTLRHLDETGGSKQETADDVLDKNLAGSSRSRSSRMTRDHPNSYIGLPSRSRFKPTTYKYKLPILQS